MLHHAPSGFALDSWPSTHRSRQSDRSRGKGVPLLIDMVLSGSDSVTPEAERLLLHHPMSRPVRLQDDEGSVVSTRTFEVVVRGRLSTALLVAFGDFEAACSAGGLTHLIGRVSDQEALHRLFRQLRDLNIELVSVNPVGEEPSGSAVDPMRVE